MNPSHPIPPKSTEARLVFSLAHLSDVHLGPLPPGAAWRNFRLKRPIGFLSWQLRRRKRHDNEVAELIAADIRAAAPDHVALTGDVVNVAAHEEFPAAARWLERLGPASALTFVPGNHDCYVRCAWEDCLGHLAPWMVGDMRVKATETCGQIAVPFPFVRLRRNVALIGLATGRPQALHRAAGSLGKLQIDSLAVLLRDLRERGYARVVLIHHPPLPGLASNRKALDDALALKDVLAAEGAEVVLYGHNHRHMVSRLPTRFGTCHAVGVASASMRADAGRDAAAWHRLDIVRQDGRWLTRLTVRGLDAAGASMTTTAEYTLSS
jgi:3',5'-cyclic AMP phosphodiesterase CpdA